MIILLTFLLILFHEIGCIDRDTILGRSTMYSGMQTKSSNPVYFGLAWNDHNDERGTFFFRERSLPGDLQTTIRFKRCDGLNFCHTEIIDTLHTELHLRFRWIKPDDRNDSFSLIVDGWSEDLTFGESSISIFSYIGVSNPNARIWMSSSTSIDGVDPDFGPFRLSINETKHNNHNNHKFSKKNRNTKMKKTLNEDIPFYYANRTKTPFYMTNSIYPEIMIHGVTDLKSPACCFPWNHRRVLPNIKYSDNPNIIILQSILTTPFTSLRFDFFNPKSPPSPFNFEDMFQSYVKNFESQFDQTFPIFNFLQNVTSQSYGNNNNNNEEEEEDDDDGDEMKKKNDDRAVVITKEEWREFALTTFSSLMTGLSYYEGLSYYKDEFGNVHQNPTTHRLLSMVPSKKGFPHPFYWDESFHQMVSMRMYPELHETITKYWYDLQNTSTGWIAREQVIGWEALDLCPPWAWADSVKNMNPPSYFISTEMFMNIFYSNDDDDSNNNNKKKKKKSLKFHKYLSGIYEALKKTSTWYLENTESKYTPRTYKWNGRIGDGSYDSGLDDFPRFNPPRDSEVNVDLQSWIGKVMNVMKNLAGQLGYSDDEKHFSNLETEIVANLHKYFWNDDAQFYVDATTTVDVGSSSSPSSKEYSEHIGVVGLLPVCLGLENNLTRVESIVSKIENELYDENGIMSLSKNDPWFVPGDGDYWRGNIWVNQQYLCFRGLKRYVEDALINLKEEDEDGGRRKLSKRVENLRKQLQLNLANMMYKNYQRGGGGIFETYHPGSGKGYNHLPFTGWSTLIVLIMAEDYR